MNVVAVGATSAMVQEYLKLVASRGKAKFALVGRNETKLKIVADDLLARGALDVRLFAGDLLSQEFQQRTWEVSLSQLGSADVCIMGWGALGDELVAQQSVAKSMANFEVNFTSYVSWLIVIAPHFSAAKSGSIIAICSVAGDRGRQSNYTYGTAKGALSTYLQGFRNRMAVDNVQVLTVKPGFVDSPMTAHLKKNALYASPQQIGRDIDRAVKCKRDVIYTPWFWRWIMMLICAIPERLFKRLKL